MKKALKKLYEEALKEPFKRKGPFVSNGYHVFRVFQVNGTAYCQGLSPDGEFFGHVLKIKEGDLDNPETWVVSVDSK